MFDYSVTVYVVVLNPDRRDLSVVELSPEW